MGYDVHITRSDDWADSETNPISLEDWLEYLQRDPEMRLVGFVETRLPNGQTLRYERPGLAAWTKQGDDSTVHFDLRRGRVTVKNPDRETLAKMTAVAVGLRARVQGDDG